MFSPARIVGLLLTLLFLALALRNVDPAALAAELRQMEYWWLLPSALCTLGGYALRTVRWQALLSGAARAPLRTLFPILIMGFAINNLLPGRLGELWRAYLLGSRRNVRKTSALASIFVERIFDGLALIALLSLVSTFVRLPGWGREVQTLSSLVFLGATAGLTCLVLRPGLIRAIVAAAARPLPARLRARVLPTLDGFIDGAAILRQPSVLAWAALCSLGVWGLEGASYYLLSRGLELGLPPGTELPAMGLTLVMINLGIMVPSGPGYVGTQEFFGTRALGVFGVSVELALALVLVSHAIQYLLVTGLGLFFFARQHLSVRRLGALSRVSARSPLAVEVE